jgi:hypothetical protein
MRRCRIRLRYSYIAWLRLVASRGDSRSYGLVLSIAGEPFLSIFLFLPPFVFPGGYYCLLLVSRVCEPLLVR